MSHGPKILLLDIETLPNLIATWDLKVPSGYIPHENIIKERSIICAAWKWLGAPKIYSSVADPDVATDSSVLLALHGALSKADAVVAHNGDNFDIPWIMGRMIHAGFAPPPQIIQIDTYKIAKARFKFNSSSLAYLAKFLGLPQKTKTEFSLWLKCMNGDAAALKKMVDYNKQDVLVLEKLFLTLRPYVNSKINHALWDDEEKTCPTCGDRALEARGNRYSRATVWARYQCRACGAWSQKPPNRGTVR